MKYLIIFITFVIIGTQSWVIKVQADNNKQLMYDLNVTQTAFDIQSAQIAQGLCLPRLEMK
jgi:uncharacterized membrane protein YciS (DUF1049 family)